MIYKVGNQIALHGGHRYQQRRARLGDGKYHHSARRAEFSGRRFE